MAMRRVLVKISGEALLGGHDFGIDQNAAMKIAKWLSQAAEKVQVAVVLGGGNLFRGLHQATTNGMQRSPADQIGMLATLMNGIALRQALESFGSKCKLLNAFECSLVEHFRLDKAVEYLSNGSIVLFTGGTGHPYFTTDTCAALRASEIGADLFAKATTRVDGIYTQDPRKFPEAKKYHEITYQKILADQLGILDLTAVTLCMTSKVPIRVFNLYEAPLLEAISEKSIHGTLVTGEK